jgi:hypothetical protein
MRSFRIPVFLLLLLLVLTLAHSALITRQCRAWDAVLLRAEQSAAAEDRTDAAAQLDAFAVSWARWRPWLHMTVSHGALDEAEACLRRCLALCRDEEDAELRAALSDLRTHLLLLDQRERLSAENIL